MICVDCSQASDTFRCKECWEVFYYYHEEAKKASTDSLRQEGEEESPPQGNAPSEKQEGA